MLDEQDKIGVFDYLMGQAPKEVPNWFVPKMNEEKPGEKLIDADGNVYASHQIAEKAVGNEEDYWDDNEDARKAWELEYKKQKVFQWPFEWALRVIQFKNEVYES